MIFAEKTFADCSLLQCQRMPHPKFRKEIFAYSHKTAKIAKVFSLKSFPLYGIYQSSSTPHISLLIANHHLSRTVCPIVYNEYITRPHENHEMYRLVKTCIDTCIVQTKSTCLYCCSHRIGLGEFC